MTVRTGPPPFWIPASKLRPAPGQCDNGDMSEEWKTTTADQVGKGDRIRLASGRVLTVTTIEKPFLGRAEMLAFIEDTPEGWYKQPMATSAEVAVEVPA